ncbi:hypothetical protein QBC33DRAFT_522744 [Phialemonium atrogriseum]|uniref:Succinate dehydrogenase assembly factor 4, mitochondrial n=1 Tax=Phialemonium atrogriseum TaxID=1093897 RepID=A0AAJ0C9Z6_9PEZI|nr:uncharacterized protein QBC33DRAFT_522744 [Phialemonium atrogriseum]KAK1772880.1 hypothetical protein QBC33DRAFT_522744 [Phialemonium atrogriseum]
MSRALLVRSLLRRHPRPAPATTPPPARAFSSSFDAHPSPPRLPPDQQAEFERLQRAAEARLSTHTQQQQPTTPPPSPLTTSRHVTDPGAAKAPVTGTGELPASPGTLSGGIRQGAPPEFDGEVNPRTGEVGGPKNEPLRWGGEGDWSYNGRVTDF